jgi:hypothetical protein
LGDLPVLAKAADKITACGGDGKGFGAWIIMVHRFLLNGVNVSRTGITINQGKILAVAVFPHTAGSPLPVCHPALMGAQFANNFFVSKFLIVPGWMKAPLGCTCDRGREKAGTGSH